MTSPSLITERDAAGAYELLASATDDPTVLAVVTDEELLALEGVDGAELAGSPFLDASDFDREQAAAVAVRSLIARGLVVLEDSEQETEGEELASEQSAARAAQLDRSLAGLLTLRSTPLAVLNLTRQVADQTTALMVYVFPRGGILEELVTADGFHHFSLPTRQATPARLARYADQAQVAGNEEGRTVTATAAQLDGEGPLAQQLQDTRALTVITSASAGGSTQTSVMATSETVFAMETPSRPEEEVSVRELSSSSLQDLIAAALPEVSGL